ncbi:MAG: 23S rRNA (cytosine(1962)-C(5))-methyltransferase RlmI [Phototrophicales bacterium]|nr:MAG: 23S rRNA (cytosine(1962)-C(5))-methyltransferase RlmI [Phototrophicales bacterium]
MSRIIVRPDREKPILNRHPWVFSGAIDSVRGSPQPGEIVDVIARDGSFLARGYFNPRSQIQVRLLTWADGPIDDSWWRRMIGRAVSARIQRSVLPPAVRLINAENDFLPGLIVDRYGDYLVLQALTLHIDQRKTDFASILVESMAEIGVPIRGVFERSDVDVRKKEGLALHTGLLWGEQPPELLSVPMSGTTRLIDVRTGHKTGAYLDQIGNQAFLDDFLNQRSIDGAMLSLFSYTGGFGLGSRCQITQVDSSLPALELAERMYQTNRFPADRVEFIQANVFDLVRDFVDEGRRFDVIVCDPPKFAHNAGQVERAARGYKDLNLNCFKLLQPGGYLMTFSCSGAISADLFQKIVFGALADSGRDAQVIRTLSASDDHPVALTFPEGAYLKGLLLRVY